MIFISLLLIVLMSIFLITATQPYWGPHSGTAAFWLCVLWSGLPIVIGGFIQIVLVVGWVPSSLLPFVD